MNRLVKHYRIVTFVPAESIDSFVTHIAPLIPAFLGTYSDVCWWSAPGTEHFRPDGADRAQQEPSIRFECSIPKDKRLLMRIIEQGIKKHHPWVEPVILVSEQKIYDHKTK